MSRQVSSKHACNALYPARRAGPLADRKELFPKTDLSDYNCPAEGREVLHRVRFTRLRSAAGLVCLLRLFSITFVKSRYRICKAGLQDPDSVREHINQQAPISKATNNTMPATAELDIREGEAVLDLQPLTEESVKELVQLFKLLADETRMRILHLLHQSEELNVLELCRLLEQRQPSVSHHLALLRVAGLIDMRREGKHNYYRIVREQFEKLVGKVFEAAPSRPFQIMLGDHVLHYGPVGEQ